MASLSNDDALLAHLGYKQELKRDFKTLELVGLSFSIIGVVQAIAAVLIYAIPYGGAVSVVWGWFTYSIFLIIMACALAELGSAAPTIGGLYYWTFSYASPKYRNILSWIVGYSDAIAYISGVAGTDYACAAQIVTAASIASDGAYVPTNAQIYGVYAAILLVHTFMASMATRTIARLENFYLLLNLMLFLGFIIALPIVTPSELKNDRSYAFGHFENLTSWPNGFAFIFSFLAPAWSIGALDSSVHISEEAKNASIAVPIAMISSVSLGCVLGWITNIVIVFYMGSDMASLVQDGQPMAAILLNSFGLKGFLVIWSFIIVTLFMAGMNLLVAGSRQMFAFSRDGALPFSKYIYSISPRTNTPAVAVFVSAFIALLLCLLSFAGTAAITAVFTMSVVCQYIAYSIPIASRWLGGQEFKKGPFSLGALSAPISWIAVAFMSLIIVILLFPTEQNPTSQTMNYTVVVVGGILLLATIYYYFPVYGGKHWFKGPVQTIDHVSDESGSEVSGEKASKMSQE